MRPSLQYVYQAQYTILAWTTKCLHDAGQAVIPQRIHVVPFRIKDSNNYSYDSDSPAFYAAILGTQSLCDSILLRFRFLRYRVNIVWITLVINP